MSQENSQVASETASEQPTTETTDNSTDVSSLVAESKKYRKRSQDAEARLAELEKKLASAEEAKLKEKEDFKALYEKVSSENEAPEEERERLAGLDLDTLEYVTGKINSSKANAPEVAGNPRQNHKTVTKDWTTMDEKERRDNWADIIASAKNKN
jgi:chromosome segregation ATPase